MNQNSLFFNHENERSLPKKISMVAWIALILLFIGTIGSYAKPFPSSEPSTASLQVTQVSGVITDNDGEPLPGVNVVIKGTTVGGITDLNGHYSIQIPAGQAQPVVLVYSF